MIVYKYKQIINKVETEVEINFCNDGLYIQLDSHYDDNQDIQNIIIPHEEVQILIKYLNENG